MRRKQVLPFCLEGPLKHFSFRYFLGSFCSSGRAKEDAKIMVKISAEINFKIQANGALLFPRKSNSFYLLSLNRMVKEKKKKIQVLSLR